VGYEIVVMTWLHRAKRDGTKLKVGPLEAIDGTPVVDIKPVLSRTADW
jgi:tRNA (Thr-GGU) A37 N-methylase